MLQINRGNMKVDFKRWMYNVARFEVEIAIGTYLFMKDRSRWNLLTHPKVGISCPIIVLLIQLSCKWSWKSLWHEGITPFCVSKKKIANQKIPGEPLRKQWGQTREPGGHSEIFCYIDRYHLVHMYIFFLASR